MTMPTDTTAESVDYFWAVWKRKWVVALFTLATLLGSYFAAQLLPKTYSAQTLVLISPPHQPRNDNGDTAADDKSGSDKIGMDPLTITMGAYHRIAESPALLEKIILNLGLKEENGKRMYVESLREIIFIEGPKNEIHSSERAKSASGLLTLNALGTDPKQITAIVNSWADILKKESRNIRSHEASIIHEKILENYNLTRAKMKKLEADLTAAKSNAEKSLLQAKSNAEKSLLQAKLNTEKSLLKLELSNRTARLAMTKDKHGIIDMKLKERKIIHSTSRYQKMKKEKAAIAKIIKTKDSADIKWDALNYLYEKYTQNTQQDSDTEDPFSNLVPEEYVDEEIKELYKITIQNEEVELAKLENKSLKNDVMLKNTSLKSDAMLRNTSLKNDAIIQGLKRELDVQVELLGKLANKAEETRMLVSAKTSDIRFAAEAIEPHLPVGPDVGKIVVLGTMTGFFLSIFLCIFSDFVVATEIRGKNRTIGV
tara:strand:- start:280 stop:1731 length:1452 start_codon:yes stop_codon:yes gene_type:complete